MKINNMATIQELEKRIQELEDKVNEPKITNFDESVLPDIWNSTLKKVINDNMFVYGTVTFSDTNPIIIPITGVTPENVVLTNYPILSYIRRSDDGLSNELFIGAGDVGGECNYVILKISKVVTSY